jgi:hypothetical protein
MADIENSELADAIANERGLGDNTESKRLEAEANRIHADTVRQANAKFKQGMMELLDGTLQGDTGLNQTTEMLNTLSGGLQRITASLPLLSEKTKAFLASAEDGVGEVANALINYNTEVFGKWQQVSKAGAGAVDGMTGLMRQSINAGMDFRKWSDHLSKSGQDIVAFRGNLLDGAETFAKVTGKLDQDSDMSLRRLGYTADDMADSVKNYLKLQTLQGHNQGQNDDQVAKGAKEYMIHLSELSKVTGKNIEDLEKQDQERMKNKRYAAWSVIQKAEGGAEGEKRVESSNDILRATANLSQTTQSGLRDIISSNGLQTTDEGRAVYQSLGDRGVKELLKMRDSGKPIDADAVRKLINEAYTRQSQAMAERQVHAGEGAMQYGVGFGEMQKDIQLTAGNVEGRTKEIQESTLNTRDTATENNIQATQALERKNMSDMERNTELMGTGAKLTKNLAELMSKSSSGFNELTDVMKQFLDTPLAEEGAEGASDLVSKLKSYASNAFKGITGMSPSEAVDRGTQAITTGAHEAKEGLMQSMGGGGAVGTGDLSGLKIKSSESTGGGAVDSGVASAAKEIQNNAQMMPGGVNMFTAFNDRYHHTANPRSKHTQGLAFDFTVANSSKSQEAAAQVTKMMMSKGMSPGEFKVVDEYKNPSGHATGGHIHVEFANHQAASKYASLSGNTKPENIKTAEAEAEPKDKQAKPITPPSSTEVTGKNPSPTSKGYKVISMGTNDFANPKDVYANVMKVIEDAKKQGFTPVVLSPNANNEKLAKASAEVARAVKDAGVKSDSFQSFDKDNIHETMADAKRIAEKYGIKNADQIIGDSTAVRIGAVSSPKSLRGNDLLDSNGNLVARVGASTHTISGFSPTSPTTKPQEPELSAPTSRMAESPKMPEPKEEVKPKMVETETDLSKALDRIASMAERQSQKIESIISVKKPGTRNVEQIAKSMS